jgi:DNA-binding NarL/FixJ family response regulator
MPTPIKVSIVEDDKRVREGLEILINGSADLRCIRTFPNAESALKQIPHDWPDVALMDINLPNMSGIDLVARLKQMRPQLHVIMLTAYANDDQIFDSLKRGASGYLLKKTPPARILEAIVDVHGGGAPMTNSIALKVIQHFQHMEASQEVEKLTDRECQILDLLVKGLRNKEIADQLGVGVETVRTHLSNIYVKLQVTSRTEAAVKYAAQTK